MRTAVTVAKKHNGDWVMLGNPDTPLAEQNKTYRSFLLEKVHPEYCYVQLQESDGLFRRTHLRTPDEHGKHIANLEKQNEEARVAGEKEAKSRDEAARKAAEYRAQQHAEEIEHLNKLAEDQGSKAAAKPAAAPAASPEAPEGTAELKPGGPTIEEWVFVAGYKALSYPPEGFAEVDSPGLQEYKTTGKLTSPVPPAAAPVVPASTPVAAEPSAPAPESQPEAAPEPVKAPEAPAPVADPVPDPVPAPQAEQAADVAAPVVESQPEAAQATQVDEVPTAPAAKTEGQTKKAAKKDK